MSQNLAGEPIACDNCSSCLLFDALNEAADDLSNQASISERAAGLGHPDLHIVNKELARFSDEAAIRNRKLTTIPVDVLRQALVEPANRAPQLGHGKVFILDEAELLRSDGQNILLKTLEEPPAGSVIVLVTSQEDRLLPTIRSRCQRIAFLPLEPTVLHRYVQEHAADLEPVEQNWLVGFAGGSLGRVRLAMDWELNEWGKTVVPALDTLARGKPAPRLGVEMAELVNGFAEAWVKKHANASKEAANQQAATLMFSIVTGHAAQQLHALSKSADSSDPQSAEQTLQPWLNVMSAVRSAEQRLASNVNPGLVFDGLASELALALRHGEMLV
jgi:DNA polymerase-3 subunit delta'